MSELAEKLAINPLQGQVQYQEFSPLNDAAIDETWKYSLPIGLKLNQLWNVARKPLLNYGKGLALSYGKPLFSLFDRSLNRFGRLAKDYYTENIYPYKDYSPIIGDDVYYPNKSAGKPYYTYRDQYPDLRRNVRNATDNLYIDIKPSYNELGNPVYRDDATGFNNLKVNWRGKDYAYQIKKNPKTGRNEFYNIKPYGLAEKDYQYQYFDNIFRDFLENGY